jgi:hypothetical protein
MRGWGEVAIHGSEGFRAERAVVACLFVDWPWAWRGARWILGLSILSEVAPKRAGGWFMDRISARWLMPVVWFSVPFTLLIWLSHGGNFVEQATVFRTWSAQQRALST